ncbi:hypothetical protein LAZ67_18000603 [Cordylochernes scorpioides]|uniref:ribonuclease H n=1 Tax=Cordylochernes scorpioides TaxID=51811 RepID=A0ABY6LHT6_9ARAC|nr:hypothetical protein LAZ67_18000603 [Cordylochernes scorpioides]
MELRRLTRENRGLAPLVTKRLYKAGFERIICYAASVWWRQENDSLTHKILSSAQRPFALALCRGYNTLSTDAALVLSGLVPINNILTLESKRAELIRPGSDMDTDPTPEQVDLPPLQWYCHPAEVHLITYDKSIPDSSSLTIYTDGSKSDDGVGAGWCLYSRNIPLLKKSYILREENSVFQAECLAIFKALEWFLEQPHQSITLASDSLSSLESLASPYTKSWSVMRNKILVNNIINSGKTVSFHWVKAHVGLEGNEMADSLARFAFKYPAPYVPIPTPKSWFKYSARKKAISDWQTSWDASLKGRSLYSWIKFVRSDRIYSSSALNSILTGHGPFSNYFQRFKIKTASPCRNSSLPSFLSLMNKSEVEEEEEEEAKEKSGLASVLANAHPSTFFSGGTLTAQRYRDEILEPYLRPYRDQIGHNLIFMDDNARPHRARLVNEYLQSENIRRMQWPASSQDLNPIEHVWDALGRRIGARHPSPRTLVELRTALLEEWGLLPLDLLQSLVNSMKACSETLIAVRGDHTPY